MSRFSWLTLLFIALSIVACDNDLAPSQVPSIVKNTFKYSFSKAMDVEWEYIKNAYEVNFEVNNVDHEALLDSSGNLQKYKYAIDKNRLPKNLQSFLQHKYPNRKWEDPEHVIEGSFDYYQLELDSFLNDKKLVVDSLGKVLPDIKYWD